LLFFDLTPYNIAVAVKARRKLKAERRAIEEAERLAAEAVSDNGEAEPPLPAYKKEPERTEKPASRLKIVKREEAPLAPEEVFDDGFFDKDNEENTTVKESDAVAVSESVVQEIKPEKVEDKAEDDGSFKLSSIFEEHKAAQIHANDENDDAETLQVTTDRLAEPEMAPPEPEKPQWTPPQLIFLSKTRA